MHKTHMRKAKWVVAAVVMVHAMLLLAGLALAHGEGTHVLGTVNKITAGTIEVKTAKGEIVTVVIDAKTRFTRGTAVIKPTDVEVGARVAVHASTVDGKLVASAVQLPAARPASAQR